MRRNPPPPPERGEEAAWGENAREIGEGLRVRRLKRHKRTWEERGGKGRETERKRREGKGRGIAGRCGKENNARPEEGREELCRVGKERTG
jgi:hypothetical protein